MRGILLNPNRSNFREVMLYEKGEDFLHSGYGSFDLNHLNNSDWHKYEELSNLPIGSDSKVKIFDNIGHLLKNGSHGDYYQDVNEKHFLYKVDGDVRLIVDTNHPYEITRYIEDPLNFYDLKNGEKIYLDLFDGKYLFTKGSGLEFIESVAQEDVVQGHVPNAKDLSIALRDIYKPGYAFPEWAIEKADDPEYQKLVTVYYDRDDNLKDVKQQTLQREPCNIEMKRFYYPEKMEEIFGWKYGYYGEHFKDTGKLAPNIAIYCKTPVEGYPDIHVINSVGYAFDIQSQPDYKYFIKGSHEEELIARYESVFEKIYRCAEDKNLNTVVMSLVGGGAFSKLYEDFLEDVWIPAFLNVYDRHININTLFMGFSNSFRKLGIRNIGFFPENIQKVNAESTLFVNAWDPWSLPGNGNEKDESLDGHMGRVTMIGPLCFPPTNPKMNKYVAVE